MRLLSKQNVGKLPVYDLSVEDKEQYVFENGIVTHNTGIYYSSNTVLFITRSQEKEGTDLAGFKFTIITDKSRGVREKSKFPLVVTFDKGINKYSGLLDLCVDDLGFVKKPKVGWYSRVINGVLEERSWRAKDTNCAEFWDPILIDPAFDKACSDKFKLSSHEANDVDEEPAAQYDEESY